MTDRKVDYGIDAPGVVRNLFIAAAACAAYAMWGPDVLSLGGVHLKLRGIALVTAIICGAEGIAMLLYAKVGKHAHRDRMLALHAWRGDEAVLDVGTGRGLLAIGAAKKLTSGRAVGIDIWAASDLSGNNADASRANAAAEGIEAKVRFDDGDITKAPFADASFDVVVSNLCLHNIGDAAGREQACREIHRVLKTGGVAIISDFRHVRDYAPIFESLGMSVQRRAPHYFTTFPPLSVVTAIKR